MGKTLREVGMKQKNKTVVMLGVSVTFVVAVMAVFLFYSRDLSRRPLPGSATPQLSTEETEYFKSKVLPVIKGETQPIFQCLNDFLKAKHEFAPSGGVLFAWTVLSNGQANDIQLISSDIPSPSFLGCLQGLIATWRFPSPGVKSMRVHHQFQFRNKTPWKYKPAHGS